MTHEEILITAERQIEMKLLRHERNYQALRATLVQKYTEEGVKKVEEKILGH